MKDTPITIANNIYEIRCIFANKRKNTNDKGNKFLTDTGVVIVNGLFFIAAFILFNDAVTIATGETHQATVTGITHKII